MVRLICLCSSLLILILHATVSIYRFIFFFIRSNYFFLSWLLNLRLLKITIILIHIILVLLFIILIDTYTRFSIFFYPRLAQIFLFFIYKPKHVWSRKNDEYCNGKSYSNCCVIWFDNIMSNSWIRILQRLHPC